MKILSFVGIMLAVTCYLEEGAALKQYCKADDEEPWSYNGKSNGPSEWGETYPKCYGSSQSPINIEFLKATRDPNLKHLQMNNYNVPVQKAEIINNGHTAMITPKDGVNRTIQANGDTFTLAQLHFHWGSHYDSGAEHLFYSKAFALEAHFVHTNDAGDIAVVGVIYQDAHINNTGFKPISEALPQIRFKNEQTQLRSQINLLKLLPRLPLRIYRYTGSLTTPACTEGVTWSVARDIARIGTRQLNELRSLYSVTRDTDHTGCQLQDNYRPVQPLNGRKVTVST